MAERAHTATRESLVLLNTGDGKGKSTAAFGVIIRALAQGWRVGVIQFLKSDGWQAGEELMFRRLGVEWLKGGDGFVRHADDDQARARALATWELAAAALVKGEYQLLVLDEITLPITLGWIEAEEVSAAVRQRATGVNVILTGRQAPASLVEAADTVTEMVKIRHPFDTGTRARAGIDF
jgi:cob(I)alamin adenosyltransferase